MTSLTPKTFVSCDFAHAPRLWAAAPEAMRLSVEMLYACAVDLLGEFDGRECRTHRREWMAIFDTPTDAVEWGCAFQRALLELDWPAQLLEQPGAGPLYSESGELLLLGLRANVGIALGHVSRRRSSFDGQLEMVGETVELAAMLASSGASCGGGASSEPASLGLDSAGQAAEGELGTLILSSPTYHAISPEFWHQFDGLVDVFAAETAEGSEHTWPRMVVPPGLIGRKNARLQRGPRHRHNLPSYDSRFIGRFEEVGRLSELLLQCTGWTTLVGPAGAGKTRLTAEFGRRWLEEPVDSRREAWFCDLTEMSRLDDVLYGVARVLGVQLRPDEETERLAERLGSALGGRGELLLILDNAEDTIDTLADVLDGWTSDADNVHITVTSRRPSGHPHESVLPVETLGAASARALLEDRLAAPKRLRVSLGPSDRAALDTIVEYCGELPLALELAAASGRALSPRHLLRAWSSDGDNTPIARLEKAIERTFSLLGDVEREVLVQCSIFCAGFSVEDAEAVVDLASSNEAVVAALDTLHEHSLLQSQPGANSAAETRFGMYEPVRRFARRKLDSACKEELSGRHARWFVEWGKRACARMNTAEEVRWIERLVESLPNLEQAWEHARSENAELAVHLIEVLGELDTRIGPLGGQTERVDEAVELGASLDDPRFEITARYVRGVSSLRGDHDVDDDFEKVLDFALEAADTQLELEARFGLAFACMNKGLYRQALDHGERTREMTANSGTVDEVTAISWCGVSRYALGETEEALRLLGEAVVLARRLRIPSCIAGATSSLAMRLTGARAAEGMRYLEEANEMFRVFGNRRQYALSLLGLARLSGWTDDHAQAERYYDRAKEACEAIGESQYDALLLQGRGRSRLLQGDYTAARADLVEALLHLEGRTYVDLDVWVHASLGACYAALSRISEAEKHFAQARELIDGTEGNKLELFCDVIEGYLFAARARQAFAAGDEEAATDHLRRAYASAERLSPEDVPRFDNAAAVARGLRAALDAQVEEGLVPAHAAPSRRIIEVGADTRWFAVDRGEQVDISRRGALRKILAALIDRRLASPGDPMSVDEVMAAGWPDEVLTPSSGARRVYSTINRMRELGLEDVLETVDEGYMIDPAVTPVRTKRRE